MSGSNIFNIIDLFKKQKCQNISHFILSEYVRLRKKFRWRLSCTEHGDLKWESSQN